MMIRIPNFLREFSREHSTEERNETAQHIRDLRQTYRGALEREPDLRAAVSGKEQSLEGQDAAIQGIQQTISESSTGFWRRLWNSFRLKKLNADLSEAQTRKSSLQADLERLGRELEGARSTLTPNDKDAQRRALQEFYAQQQRAWENAPYSSDEVAKLFCEEHLASLSLDEYVLLLRRFPCEMVTHVTRQGIRDHVCGMHNAGQGEYADGFLQMLADGRLKSTVKIAMEDEAKLGPVQRFLEARFPVVFREPTMEGSLAALDYHLESGRFLDRTEMYADHAASHVALDEVADSYYGSERGNEIFIVYPFAHIASQFAFMGAPLVRRQSNEAGRGGPYNDLWVWTAEEHLGLSLDAAVVFLPAQARVDPRTGSRYLLDENMRPLEDENAICSLMQAYQKEGILPFLRDVDALLLNKVAWDERTVYDARLRKRLQEEFGITDGRVQDAMLQQQFVVSELLRWKEKGAPPDDKHVQFLIRHGLSPTGALYRKPPLTISSREFWERYFQQYPDQRPSKVVYYEGEDPTAALDAWRETQGLTRRSAHLEEEHYGYPANYITREQLHSLRANPGRDRFRSIAIKVIRKVHEERQRNEQATA